MLITIPMVLSFHAVMVLVLVFSVFSFIYTIDMLNFVVSVEIVRNGDFALFLEDGTKLKMTVMRQSVNSRRL